MLKLDAETRDIPVLTHTERDGDEEEDEEEAADSSDVELFAAPAIVRMN